MKTKDSSDHLTSSFTDLMTSLVVIFILLFLAFVNGQKGGVDKVKSDLLRELQEKLKPAGLDDKNIRKEGDAVVIVVPEGLMNFQSGSANLSDNGRRFIKDNIPLIAGVLAKDRYADSVDSVIVEGQTDRQHQFGHTVEQGQEDNLQLSQGRSMEVVKEALHILSDKEHPNERRFFLDRLSATGRGEQEALKHLDRPENDPEYRRVLFRIRIRSNVLKDATETIRAGVGS